MTLSNVSGYTLSVKGKSLFLTRRELLEFYRQSKTILGQHITRPNNVLELLAIIEQVSGVTEEQITSRSRRELIVFARAIFCVVLSRKFSLSNTEIAHLIHRDCSLVSYFLSKNYLVKPRYALMKGKIYTRYEL